MSRLRLHSLYESMKKKISPRGRPGKVRSRCKPLPASHLLGAPQSQKHIVWVCVVV